MIWMQVKLMSYKSRFLVYVSIFLLSFSLCFQNTICEASTEIIYDDGDADYGWYDKPTGILIGMKFSATEVIDAPIELQEISIYVIENPAPLEILIYDENLKKIDSFTISPKKTGWYTKKKIIGPICGDFYIFLHWIFVSKPIIGVDSGYDIGSHTYAISVDNPSKLMSKSQLEKYLEEKQEAMYSEGPQFMLGAGGSEEINIVSAGRFGIMIRSSINEDRNSVKAKENLQLANEYFDAGKYKDAKYHFRSARYYFNILHDEQKIKEIESKIEICNKKIEEASSPATTPPPTTQPPATTPPPTTQPPATTLVPISPPQHSNSFLYLGTFVIIVILTLAIYQIVRGKPEKKIKKKLAKKMPEKEKPKEDVSSELKELLEERKEWKTKLENLREEKDNLISKGIMTEEEYQEKYNEIMDKLVGIEDKVIKQKMEMGAKK